MTVYLDEGIRSRMEARYESLLVLASVSNQDGEVGRYHVR